MTSREDLSNYDGLKEASEILARDIQRFPNYLQRNEFLGRDPSKFESPDKVLNGIEKKLLVSETLGLLAGLAWEHRGTLINLTRVGLSIGKTFHRYGFKRGAVTLSLAAVDMLVGR